MNEWASFKDMDGLVEVFQVPVNAPQTILQLIGCPIKLLLVGGGGLKWVVVVVG